MGQYPVSRKIEAMDLWARGCALREVASRLGVNPKVVQRWKENHSPEDWDQYRLRVVRESVSIAARATAMEKAEVRKRLAVAGNVAMQAALQVLTVRTADGQSVLRTDLTPKDVNLASGALEKAKEILNKAWSFDVDDQVEAAERKAHLVAADQAEPVGEVRLTIQDVHIDETTTVEQADDSGDASAGEHGGLIPFAATRVR